jgi:hypothetical protein
MKEMMFEFLDNFGPEVYFIRTRFGLIARYKVKYTDSCRYVKTLCNFFSCESEYGLDIYKQWLSSKPVYTYVKNSTNGNTLVRESNPNNCVTFPV